MIQAINPDPARNANTKRRHYKQTKEDGNGDSAVDSSKKMKKTSDYDLNKMEKECIFFVAQICERVGDSFFEWSRKNRSFVEAMKMVNSHFITDMPGDEDRKTFKKKVQSMDIRDTTNTLYDCARYFMYWVELNWKIKKPDILFDYIISRYCPGDSTNPLLFCSLEDQEQYHLYDDITKILLERHEFPNDWRLWGTDVSNMTQTAIDANMCWGDVSNMTQAAIDATVGEHIFKDMDDVISEYIEENRTRSIYIKQFEHDILTGINEISRIFRKTKYEDYTCTSGNVAHIKNFEEAFAESDYFSGLVKVFNSIMTSAIIICGTRPIYKLEMKYLLHPLSSSDHLIGNADIIELRIVRTETRTEINFWSDAAWPSYLVGSYEITKYSCYLKVFALPGTQTTTDSIGADNEKEILLNQFIGKKWGKILFNFRMLIGSILGSNFTIEMANDKTNHLVKDYQFLSEDICSPIEQIMEIHFNNPTDNRNFEIMAQIAWRQLISTIVKDTDVNRAADRFASLMI